MIDFVLGCGIIFFVWSLIAGLTAPDGAEYDAAKGILAVQGITGLLFAIGAGLVKYGMYLATL